MAPNHKNNQTPNNQDPNKKKKYTGFISIILWALILTLLANYFLSGLNSKGIVTVYYSDFRNAVVVMTSNVGAKRITAKGRGLGFSDHPAGEERPFEQVSAAVMEEVKRVFRPEFLNRVDEIIVFRALGREDIAAIARKMLDTVSERLAGKGISLSITDGAVELLAERGFDPNYGARPLRRAIRTHLEDPAARLLLEGSVSAGNSLEFFSEKGELFLRPAVKEEREAQIQHDEIQENEL